jgi:hypothetical protein
MAGSEKLRGLTKAEIALYALIDHSANRKMDDTETLKIAPDYVGTEDFNEWIKKLYSAIISKQQITQPTTQGGRKRAAQRRK